MKGDGITHPMAHSGGCPLALQHASIPQNTSPMYLSHGRVEHKLLTWARGSGEPQASAAGRSQGVAFKFGKGRVWNWQTRSSFCNISSSGESLLQSLSSTVAQIGTWTISHVNPLCHAMGTYENFSLDRRQCRPVP